MFNIQKIKCFKLFIFGVTALMLSCCASQALGFNFPWSNKSKDLQSLAELTKEFNLPNGLKLIVREDHRAPVVVNQVWYKVGSSYEHNGITGISHMLEHMMFKGTDKYALGEFDKIVSRNGGMNNAFTSNDYTAYYELTQVGALEQCFALEADRMRGLNLPALESEFNKEKLVVMEERRWRTDDKPEERLYEKFLAISHIGTPYYHPVIGWMSDIENYNIQDLNAWYKRYYAPNNAILVIVGNVNPEEVYKLALKYFGDIQPSDNIPVLKPQHALENFGKREFEMHLPANNQYLMLGYNVPAYQYVNRIYKDQAELKSRLQDIYALDILAYVLAGGDSSRLTKELIREKKIAASIDVSYSPFSLWETVFVIYGNPNPGIGLDKLENSINNVILDLQNNLINETELNRIKRNIIANRVYKRDSIVSQAIEIGTLEATNLSWTLSDTYADQILNVTPEDLKKVAVKYFIDNKKIVGRLYPDAA